VKIIIGIFFWIVVGFASLGLLNIAHSSEASLIMGVFPRHNVKNTILYYKPLAEKLTKALKRSVKLETAKNFSVFWQRVTSRRYDIVHYNQFHYINSHNKIGYEVIARNVEFGSDRVAGAIIVRKDSGIHSIDDLKGKTIIFGGDKSALVSYIATTNILRNAGLQSSDYIEKFAKAPPYATIATYAGRADAAAVGDIGLKIPMVVNAINTNDLKVLAQGPGLAHLPWAVKRTMSSKLKQKIQKIMLSLEDSVDGQMVLKKAHINRFVKTTDADYDSVRQLIQQVGDVK